MAKIITEHGERQKLAELFHTTQPTVRAALRGQTNTPLAQKIRAAALKRGGAIANNNQSNK